MIPLRYRNGDSCYLISPKSTVYSTSEAGGGGHDLTAVPVKISGIFTTKH